MTGQDVERYYRVHISVSLLANKNECRWSLTEFIDVVRAAINEAHDDDANSPAGYIDSVVGGSENYHTDLLKYDVEAHPTGEFLLEHAEEFEEFARMLQRDLHLSRPHPNALMVTCVKLEGPGYGLNSSRSKE